uniref:Centrosomal protein 57kDa-like protein 1 n=1 Tax=Gasterosteus aculeatus aculeatus TaxID=481459 RepID=G3P2B5_GASAC|nr:centrosomal protein CEP57L1 [Gasterosteus aculeatus aculeatus]
METYHDQIFDSPSKNSYIGSYYQPPNRIVPTARQLEFPGRSSNSTDPQMTTKPKIDSTAVVDALKTLQEKIRRLELERKQAQKSYGQFSQDAWRRPEVTGSLAVHSQAVAGQPATGNSGKKELDSKMQSAETRCKVLEKQLDYMRKMVESAKKERNVLMENQASLQNQQPCSSNTQCQRDKLEKLESECLKLSQTQTLAETKLAILEQKLLKEEHERKIVQEKADQLQRELEINFQLSVPTADEIKPKKKTPKNPKKTSRQTELPSPRGPRHKIMPFVAGTSTSPSHSVHANVQSILHMMKHHQPQLCERVSTLHRSGCGAKKSLQRDFVSSSTTSPETDGDPIQAEHPLGSLSELLLALQDELGQMSFEHQELVHQIESTQHCKQKPDLQRELESLIARMEEKGAQITKLRKHQQKVHKLCAEEHAAKTSGAIRPPVPSPVKAKSKRTKGGANHNNLQLLRDTQKFRNSLKQDDLSWET